MSNYSILSSVILLPILWYSSLTQKPISNPLANMDDYILLAQKVKAKRENRLINLDQFNDMAKKKNTIILDARSSQAYKSKHITGATNLDFTDFNERNLRHMIPDTNTTILIYCNNNFMDDEMNFPMKMPPQRSSTKKIYNSSLALNLATFINLEGYGYHNVFELNDVLSVKDSRIKFNTIWQNGK